MTFKRKGVYRIFNCTFEADFFGADVEFESVLGRAMAESVDGRFPSEVRIGIVDSGVYITPHKDNDYFATRWVGGRDFTQSYFGTETHGQPESWANTDRAWRR